MWAIVPCKRLHAAKRRLSGVLTAPECRQLVLSMLSDVLGIVASAPGIGGVLVVSSDSDVADLARSFDARCLTAHCDEGLSRAFSEAGRTLSEAGADGVIAIPGDLPLLRPEDIECVLNTQNAPSAVAIAPDRHESGTNLLAMKPVGIVPFLFGEESLLRHLSAARERGIEPAVIRTPSMALDIDTPADLVAFARRPSATRTFRYLVERGIGARLAGSIDEPCPPISVAQR